MGNSNIRVQFRDLASGVTNASPTLNFSVLTQESSTSYSAETYFGFNKVQAGESGGYALTPPNAGFDVGYVNGALTLFYNSNASNSSLTSETLLAASSMTANSTYLVSLQITGINGSNNNVAITPTVYNSADVSQTLAGGAVSAILNLTTATTSDIGTLSPYISAGFTGSGATAYFAQATLSSVPEPSSAALVTIALMVVGACAVRKRSRRIGV